MIVFPRLIQRTEKKKKNKFSFKTRVFYRTILLRIRLNETDSGKRKTRQSNGIGLTSNRPAGPSMSPVHG